MLDGTFALAVNNKSCALQIFLSPTLENDLGYVSLDLLQPAV